MNKFRMFLFLVCTLCSCTNYAQRDNELDLGAKELVEKAKRAVIIGGYYPDSVKAALKYLDVAIDKDSVFIEAYSKKADILCKTGHPQKALETTEAFLRVSPSSIEMMTQQAFLLDYNQYHEKAIQLYKKIYQEYTVRLSTDTGNAKLQINRALMGLYLHGKDFGLKEFERIKQKYPEDNDVWLMEEVFTTFNYEKAIANYCSKEKD